MTSWVRCREYAIGSPVSAKCDPRSGDGREAKLPQVESIADLDDDRPLGGVPRVSPHAMFRGCTVISPPG